MSVINVTVTNSGSANVSVSNGSTVNATVGNGGAVNVALGTISPGNATVVSGTLTINSTTTLAAGSQAYVKNDAGTAFAAKLDIGIPAGPATLVSVGNTTTLAAGSNATVNGTTSGSNLTLTFGIPQGASGINGVTPSFSIGNVATGAAGSSALVTATTTNSGANVTLDLTIPRGDPGTSGSNGTNGTVVTLSDATPANLGTAAAGSSNLVARADHIHSLPVIAYSNLSGVPANFPTNTTLVSGLNSSYSAIGHGHNYVTSINGIAGALTLAPGPNVTISANNLTLTIDSVGGGISQNDAVDGGDYIGQILGGITFATQPQSQTLNAVTTLSFSNVITPTVANSGFLHSTTAYGNHIFATASRSGGGTEGNPYFGIVDIVKSANNGSSFTHELEVSKFQSESNPVPVSPTTELSFPSNGSRVVFTDGRGGLRYFDGGGSIATSTGPITPLGISSVGIAYLASAGRFVSIADTRIASSSDGVSWTQRLNYEPSRNQFIFAIGGRYVVLPNRAYLNGDAYSSSGSVTNPAIHHSTDGVTWTTVVKSYGYNSAASNGSRIVAARDNRSSVDYSTDGLAWTTVSLPVAVQTVSHAAGMFWAFSGSTDVLTSPDGVTWTLRELPPAAASDAAMAEGSNVAFLLGSVNNAVQATTSTAAASANLTVSATSDGGAAVSYQWQRSLDAGSTWANVSNATTSTLSLTGLTTANSGTRYRAAASATGATTALSQSAILTITG
jgi:hypothetical protein